MSIWDILEIEPLNDVSAIKSAYAKLSKKYHPEEQPEKWEELHKAYKSALNYAKNHSSLNHMQIKFPEIEYGLKMGEEQQNVEVYNESCEQTLDMQIKFPEIEYDFESGEEQQKTNIEVIKKVLEKATDIVCSYYECNNKTCWEDFLNSEDFKKVSEQQKFIDTFADWLHRRTHYFWTKTLKQFFDYYNFSEYINADDAGKYKKLFCVLHNELLYRKGKDAKRDKDYKKFEKSKYKTLIWFCLFIVGIIVAPILIWLLMFLFFVKPAIFIFLIILWLVTQKKFKRY